MEKEDFGGGIEAEVSPHLPTEEVENDHIFLFGIVRDRSGSMDGYQSPMKKSTQEFIESIKGSKQDDEILVSLTEFDDKIDSYGYVNIDDMPTNFQPRGATALYDAIIVAQKRLFDSNGGGRMEEFTADGVRARGALVIFSDGYDNDSQSSVNDAKRAIDILKKQEVMVAFVAFGGAAKGIAAQLGISAENTLETDATASDLRRIWGILSKSAVSASKNAAAGVSQDAFFEV
jgi:hypothetical protein